ncbi:MAG: Uncharacterised protein [Formosa sp. Hel1_33_131]|nr:MAG: Uncharacterised protein [Formosa sp. Hel1_33_131]
MKTTTKIAVAILLAFNFGLSTLQAQSPEKMSYQAVIRNSSDVLVTSQAVGMQLSILQGSATGTAVYVETQTPDTNSNGLVSLEIGIGTTTDDFSTIDWSAGPYFIKTETDLAGGTNYTITGTSQLLSVPYALHAKTAETVTGACGLAIGDTYQGGIIFYLDASGCHGLISATADQSTGIQWYNGSNTNTTAFASCVGCGEGNTSMIFYNQGAGTYAAQICYDLILGGYSDWYLPSKDELNLMYQNIGPGNVLGLGNVGGFASNRYWSSTEVRTSGAWGQRFDTGDQFNWGKFDPNYVRAVRAF